jgi:hypothetical protein
MAIAFVIKEMSGRTASVIKFAHCINKQFCAQEVMKLTVSEEQLLSLREQSLLDWRIWAFTCMFLKEKKPHNLSHILR